MALELFSSHYLELKEYAVETPTEIVINGVQEKDALEFFPIMKKKHVSVRNIHFLGKVSPMKFSSVSSIEIGDCKFEEFCKGVFSVYKCQLFKIQNSQFIHCSRQVEKGVGTFPTEGRGIIGNLKNTEQLQIQSSTFTNCVVHFFGTAQDDETNSRLFEGANGNKIENCQRSHSCPVV